MGELQETLKERGDRYGDFTDHAMLSDGLLEVMMKAPKWKKLPPFMKQALRTIADKIARILNGDPHYTDNWHDIQGYAKLAEDRCDSKSTVKEKIITILMINGYMQISLSETELTIHTPDCITYKGHDYIHVVENFYMDVRLK